MNPWADPQGAGFHMIQSLIAVGTGGITGVGLMEGKQKLFYLPEPHTDFIFAVIAEELGLLGTLAVVVLFAVVCYRGMRAAMRTSDMFCSLPCGGHHQHHRDPGFLQHQRCAGIVAHQRHSSAIYLLWWNLAVHYVGLCRRAAEYQPAGGVIPEV